MFEKIIPVIVALIALQLLVKFKNKRKNNYNAQSRGLDYKERINQFLKISSFDQGANNEKILIDEILSNLGDPELQNEIPDDMPDIRRELYLIIDGVTHAVKGKIGSKNNENIKYNSPGKMFDDIVEVIKKYKL